jgi:hypothetical protein
MLVACIIFTPAHRQRPGDLLPKRGLELVEAGLVRRGALDQQPRKDLLA